ncbi:MAG TPA: ELM1/GtrOC1 family putative glycosyltransferase [Candidatus Omnitrophota bacterium]|nr:ELM1/GtrOC1 family putative glycosyltransferase [Candidatus Omnitrophota bacterium]
MSAESILFYCVKIFAAIVQRLPLTVALWLGRMIGLLGYLFDHRHRSLAYANLKIAFAREKKTSEIKRILRRTFENYGQNLIELLRLPVIDPQTYIKVEGREHVERALAQGKGLIFLAMHFGSWELCNFIPQLFHHPYKVLVNPQKRYSRLDDLLNSYRQKAGAGLLNPGVSTRAFVQTLKDNEMVGMVVDQGGKTGNLVKFFGRDASMSTGAVRMALKLDVAVCFCVLIREKGYHRLVIKPQLELVKSRDAEGGLQQGLSGIVRLMEENIKQHPSEYMWFYKIWKYSKESTIVVLNDRKLGHLHQSLAVAGQIQRALAQRAIQSRLEIIDIEFKSKARERVFSGVSFASHRRVSQGRLRYLKWFLQRKSFLEVMSVKGDFVVSCGASTAGVNYFLSQDYRAKSIAIQKPGILDLDRFDLVVLPEHDRSVFYARQKNVLYTKVAPNLITQEYIQSQSDQLMMKFPALRHLKGIRVGVLWGGESKHHAIPASLAKMVMDQLKEAVESLDGQMLLTTSRRTSRETDDTIREALRGFDRCIFSVMPNHHNIVEAVGGILGLSDILVVSSDSISMVSEAISSGKKVIVFKPEKRVLGTCKHDVFVEKLSVQGHILVSEAKDIGHFVCRVAKEGLVTKPVDQQEDIFKVAQEII